MPLAAAKQWATDRFLIVSTEESATFVFAKMAQKAAEHLVIREPNGSYVAILNGPNLYNLFSNMKLNRFPGDVAPQTLTIGQLLPLNPASDFYLIEMENTHVRPDLWLQGRLPRTVLIVEQKQVLAVIPPRQFRNWLESLKTESPPLIHRRQLRAISQTPALPPHVQEPSPRATL